MIFKIKSKSCYFDMTNIQNLNGNIKKRAPISFCFDGKMISGIVTNVYQKYDDILMPGMMMLIISNGKVISSTGIYKSKIALKQFGEESFIFDKYCQMNPVSSINSFEIYKVNYTKKGIDLQLIIKKI